MNPRSIEEIAALYRAGKNVMAALREPDDAGIRLDPATAILYAYDIQSGSYRKRLDDPAFAAHKRDAGRRLGAVLDALGSTEILDAGVGEGTTLAPVLAAMERRPARVLGFDVSLSRLLYARLTMQEADFTQFVPFAAELARIPLPDASIDTVVTFHAVEPNRGREDAILSELLRVARRHLVLVEPDYESAGPDARARMDDLGYVRDLPGTLERLGHVPVRREPFGVDGNPLNPAGLTVVTKPAASRPAGSATFVSPISGKPLVAREDCLFCPEDGHAYPVISGIPCLTTWNAVLCSHLDRTEVSGG